MPYHYGFVIRAATLTPFLARATENEVATSLSQTLNQIMLETSHALDESPGGPGWELVSHNLIRLDNHLVVSFLVRWET
jgi:hypothetical protein